MTMKSRARCLWILLTPFMFSATETCSQGSAEDTLRTIHDQYVVAWLQGDEDRVLALFDPDAMIGPSGMTPLRGTEVIRDFWFPKDSSKTIIRAFSSDLLGITIDEPIAHSSQRTFLSWSYEKGSMKMAKSQWGYAMTIYRRQPDGSWKIWRHLWTDVRSVDK